MSDEIVEKLFTNEERRIYLLLTTLNERLRYGLCKQKVSLDGIESHETTARLVGRRLAPSSRLFRSSGHAPHKSAEDNGSGVWIDENQSKSLTNQNHSLLKGYPKGKAEQPLSFSERINSNRMKPDRGTKLYEPIGEHYLQNSRQNTMNHNEEDPSSTMKQAELLFRRCVRSTDGTLPTGSSGSRIFDDPSSSEVWPSGAYTNPITRSLRSMEYPKLLPVELENMRSESTFAPKPLPSIPKVELARDRGMSLGDCSRKKDNSAMKEKLVRKVLTLDAERASCEPTTNLPPILIQPSNEPANMRHAQIELHSVLSNTPESAFNLHPTQRELPVRITSSAVHSGISVISRSALEDLLYSLQHLLDNTRPGSSTVASRNIYRSQSGGDNPINRNTVNLATNSRNPQTVMATSGQPIRHEGRSSLPEVPGDRRNSCPPIATQNQRLHELRLLGHKPSVARIRRCKSSGRNSGFPQYVPVDQYHPRMTLEIMKPIRNNIYRPQSHLLKKTNTPLKRARSATRVQQRPLQRRRSVGTNTPVYGSSSRITSSPRIMITEASEHADVPTTCQPSPAVYHVTDDSVNHPSARVRWRQ